MRSLATLSVDRLIAVFLQGKLAFDIDGLSAIVPIGKTRLYEELKQGRLKAKKVGDRTVIPVWEVVRWLEAQPDYALVSKPTKQK